MYGSVKIKIKELNYVITCSICHGYLVDATSLPDCHHSFCRSCILKHVLSSNLCPVCGLLIHKTRPELNLIADQNLQQIVYKLVPGLLKDELRRREEHYSKSENNEKAAEDSLRTSDYSDKIEVDNTKVCIVINIVKALQTEKGKLSFVSKTKKFLLCPGLFTVKLLKKFVHDKCELEEAENVEIIHSSDDEFLPDHYTLLDVANIYSWKPDSHLELKCVIWNDSIFSTDQSCYIRADVDSETGSHSAEYPFQSFKEFCRHLRRTSTLCPFISPKKRHKNDRNKPTLVDVTNISKPSLTSHKIDKTIAQQKIDPKALSSHTDKDVISDSFENPLTNLAPCQAGCKLKLRIRARGIEDSVLILPSAPDSSNQVKDQEIQSNSTSECCQVQEKPYFSVRQILEGQNEKSVKKFMSKKDLFFSRLGLECSPTPNFCENILESKFKDNEPITDVPKNEMTNTHCYRAHEPLNISIDRPNILLPTPNSNVHNFKKRLLLTTVPVRARGQLWTPYKSPLKEFTGEIPHHGTNASSEANRSKSPVIIFNPALPLPSFTSLLQSFDSKRNADLLNSSDSSTAISFHQSQITPNSKIGVFISKGKSMTLEQKTKLQGDNNSLDGVSCTGLFQDESSINKSWEELQELFPRKVDESTESSLEVTQKTLDDDKESDQLQKSLHCDEESVAKSNLKWCAKSSKTTIGKQKTPPWLGKRVQLKKSPSTNLQSPNKTNEDGKVTNDDDLKSPLKKKAMIDDLKSENVSNDELSAKNDKGSLSSRICNISKRALKTIN